jgi:hypothetical protein
MRGKVMLTSVNSFDIYQIRVKGHLDSCRLRAFTDLTITYDAGGETVLTGPMPDQAALYGLLNRLRDLGIPLLSVNRISKEIEAQ